MEKQKKVVDASVIVKWFSMEENSEKALKLRDGYINGEITLIMPNLAKLEVLNALRYKKNSEEQLKKVNSALDDLQIKIDPINSRLLDKAIEVSLKYNLTIYDSIYVAVAQLNECSLITADKELFKVPNVTALDKFQLTD